MAVSTQEAVLGLFKRDNKPYNAKSLEDFLAHAGHKKAAIQRALDSLTEAGELVVKEFGKTKIWIPNQSKHSELSKEALAEQQQKLSQFKAQVQDEAEALKRAEQELSMLKTSMTVPQMQEEIQKLQSKLPGVRAKLQQVQSGAKLVSAEDRARAEQALRKGIEVWRKRKSMFRNIWDAVSENMEGVKDKQVFEEMGVDTDEGAGADVKELEKLLPQTRPSGPLWKRAKPC